eukprot:TRINITY_DN111527_c0_g1_i1.p1 TRINITY_DN111527_c0_g1~~TRINITY_DN111527_c0_g1_i1.p1  ORF type:complete len:1400 (+),score=334.49 TRINITY_DN111527_c0_g1_i1:633-4202(+)
MSMVSVDEPAGIPTVRTPRSRTFDPTIGRPAAKAPGRSQPSSSSSSSWSLIPYQSQSQLPGAVEPTKEEEEGAPATGEAKDEQQLVAAMRWDLLQLAVLPRQQLLAPSCTAIEALQRALYKNSAGNDKIPPVPSRFGRAMEWQCGVYKILLGADMVVFRSSNDSNDSSAETIPWEPNFASFKMLPPGGASEPTREERLDVFLENLMCNIDKAVWGRHDRTGRTSWRVVDTQDLPAGREPGEPEYFDKNLIIDQGQRLLHFLRQRCHRQGGTYWLFREQNSPVVELFDLSGTTDALSDPLVDEKDPLEGAFGTSECLVAPIASLCFHLAKGMPDTETQRQLLQKGVHLLGAVKQDHATLYSMAALQLACSYMRAPVKALSDVPHGSQKEVRAASRAGRTARERAAALEPAAARLSGALRYLESILKLLVSLDRVPAKCDPEADVEFSLRAELRLQAHVAYTECIVKLVKEAMIPTYSAWLSEVQMYTKDLMQQQSEGQASEAEFGAVMRRMKRLSCALLLWRLFWLCRARRSLLFLPREKVDIECWTLERDVCESMGDALYGLSRYPADDALDLLEGKMSSAEGVCELVEEGLSTWGLSGPLKPGTSMPPAMPHDKGKKKGKRLTSPHTSPRSSDGSEAESAARASRATASGSSGIERPAEKDSAVFLSKLNPLRRGLGDTALRDDSLVRDDLRLQLWSEGRAFKQSLELLERAAARVLRKADVSTPNGAAAAAAGGSAAGGGATASNGYPAGAAAADEDAGSSGRQRRCSSVEEQATLKVARKLAHLYNEEARSALIQAKTGDNTADIEELLTQAHRWMRLSGDFSNASRVLLNLSELHARRAESMTASNRHMEARATEVISEDVVEEDSASFTLSQYMQFVKAIDCCDEAAVLSENALGKKEGAFAHLRLGVHLSMRVPVQLRLKEDKDNTCGGSSSSTAPSSSVLSMNMAELADRHFGKALLAFDELKEEREVAVCHFHMADLVLQEHYARASGSGSPGTSSSAGLGVPVGKAEVASPLAPLSKARLTSALRHARRSADYWERAGALQYAKDFLAAHVRVARLLVLNPQHPPWRAVVEAIDHLGDVEVRLLHLLASRANGGDVGGSGRNAKNSSKAKDAASAASAPVVAPAVDISLFSFDGSRAVAVTSLRKEMSKVCQAVLRYGEETERLKTLYRRILRNERIQAS